MHAGQEFPLLPEEAAKREERTKERYRMRLASLIIRYLVFFIKFNLMVRFIYNY